MIGLFNQHKNIFYFLVHFLNVNRSVKFFHIEKCQDRELERVWNLTFVTKKTPISNGFFKAMLCKKAEINALDLNRKHRSTLIMAQDLNI